MWDAINDRRSVRNYQTKSISTEDITSISSILEYYANKRGPFGHHIKPFLTDNQAKDGGRIGTYGFIKNPPMFIGGIVENTFEGMIDFGFVFEEIILRLTQKELGTVWLGGTFDRKDFALTLEETEIIAAVSPVGYPEKKSVRERVIRTFAKADKRKPFDDLFYKGKELSALSKEDPCYKYLQAVQIGPSASNKQPWRIVVIDDTFHVYLQRTQGYGNSLKMDIQALDIGIALSHLYSTLLEDKKQISFINKDPNLLKDAEYVLSIKIDA